MHTHTQVFHITLAESEQQLTTTTSNLLKNSTSKLDKSPEAKTNNRKDQPQNIMSRTTWKQCRSRNQTNKGTSSKQKPFSMETRTIGLKSLSELQQSSPRVFPLYAFSSGGMRKFEESTSSVATRSSTKVRLPTPARTIFLQN